MDIANLMAYPYKTLRLDSGFRRRDKFEAPSLFVIPAKAGIQGIREKFDVYTIMALLIRTH